MHETLGGREEGRKKGREGGRKEMLICIKCVILVILKRYVILNLTQWM
jgi:hypothetical protein